MISKGKYTARALEAKLAKAGTGKDQIAVCFEIKEGDFKGQTITWYGYFTDATIDRTLESLEYMGFDGKTMSDLSSCLQNDVEIVIDHEPGFDDPSKLYARVQWVNRIGGRGAAVKQAMTDQEVSDFDSRMRAALIERKQRKAQEGRADDSSFSYGANAPGGDRPPV